MFLLLITNWFQRTDTCFNEIGFQPELVVENKILSCIFLK